MPRPRPRSSERIQHRRHGRLTSHVLRSDRYTLSIDQRAIAAPRTPTCSECATVILSREGIVWPEMSAPRSRLLGDIATAATDIVRVVRIFFGETGIGESGIRTAAELAAPICVLRDGRSRRFDT